MSWVDDTLKKWSDGTIKEKLKEMIRGLVHMHLSQGFDWEETTHLILSETSQLGITWVVLIQKWIKEIHDEEQEVVH